MPLVTIQPINATSESFSDVNFEEPHDNYTDTPPTYSVNQSPEQSWKKTDVDFTGSIGHADEYALEFSIKKGLKGALPGGLAAVEGYGELGLKIGFRYDVTFGYEFGVDYYHWANDMAVSADQDFTYCSYVEPDPDTFSLWADITIEPFLELWANFDVYLELAGYTIVDWGKEWSKEWSLPFHITPKLDLGALLETDLLTPIGELYSSPKIGLSLELPGDLNFNLGDICEFYFDIGAGAYIQFQIKGLLESILELTGDANAKFDGGKSKLDLKYYDAGKENLKSFNIHVPASSAEKVIDILAHEFKYSVEPGILLSWDGHLDAGFKLDIPTPTKYIEVAKTVTEKVCDWLPWPLDYTCEYVTKTVWEWVEVAATVVDDIKIDWDYHWSVDDELWIPFFTIPLLKSEAQALDSIKVMQSKRYPLSITQNWATSNSNSWEVNVGPSALRLGAYWGYSLDMLLKGMLYSYYKPNDQIAGHPFNYYVGVDGAPGKDGLLGGSVAAGYNLDLKVPYLNEWVTLIGYDFNSSELSGKDLPLLEAEVSCGIAALSLSSELEFHDLNKLKIAQSAKGFLGEWETSPFLTISTALDGKLFEVIAMNLGSVDVDFLFKGTGDLTGDISASGAGSFDTKQMQWDKPGDINYANIYPKADAQKDDIINVLIQNLKYNLDLDLVIRVTAKIYAQYGYFTFTYDFEIDIATLQANVNENINEPIKVTAGFNPTKITEIPEEATAGMPFLVKWETENSSAGQTRLQYGQNPYPRNVYEQSTTYKPITSWGLATHNETIILNKTGTWYFTAYLQSTNPPFNFYSKVYSVKVKPLLNITMIPENATAGDLVTVKWKITGPSSVESTSIWCSKSPDPRFGSVQGTPIQSGIAGTYTTQIKFDNIGIYYLIARAQVDKQGDNYFSEIASIKILPNIKVTVLPSPNNASIEFRVNWSIQGADYIDRTYLEYSQNSTFSENVFATVSQYGYKQQFYQTIALSTKGLWYLRVLASVNGINEVYYSKLPLNTTLIYPYSEINPAYPENITVNEPLKLYWWVFGYNNTVEKTQILYDDDPNIADAPIGCTLAHSGATTDYSDIFTFSQADRYYFQANFSVDGDTKCWYSSPISILVMPKITATGWPVNATAFTIFSINYIIDGLDIGATPVDLWYGETDDIASMARLNQSATGGIVDGNITITGIYYFAINLTFEGAVYWTDVFSFQIVPYIEVAVPWESPVTDVDRDLNPYEFAIAGIPITITWIIRNVTTINHTDIHFKSDPRFVPELVPIAGPDYLKYVIVHNQIAGWMTPEQTGTGAHYYVFSVNVTFNVKEFTWVLFRIHAICDNKTYDYYSNSSGIPVYPVAETLFYNYTVVVDQQDIAMNPKNFSVTWAMDYIIHPYSEVPVPNTPNSPGYIPYKVIGIKHANIHYMLNYDPICPCILDSPYHTNSTAIRSDGPYPGVFTDELTIASVGIYYFRIHVQYNYSSTNENFTYPLHINQSYWSPLYQINVISFGKYNTTVQAPKVNPPIIPPVSYGDYDGDGDLDIIVGDNSMGPLKTITIYFNDGTGNYTAIPPKLIDSFISLNDIVSLKAGHFNADNYLDFMMANNTGGFSTVEGWVYLNDGQCNFTRYAPTFNQAPLREVSSYFTADVTGDGIDDYIYYGYMNGMLYCDMGMADGGSVPLSQYYEPNMIETLELVDLDGSPDRDLMIGYNNQSFGLFVDFPNGHRILIQNVTASFNRLNYPLYGDFNSDGFNDTIVVNNTGEVILTLNTTIFPISRTIAYAAASPQGMATGDFDKDGDLDFVIGIGANQFQFFFSNYSIGFHTWPGFSSQIVQNGGDVLATGDFNNDSYIDISAYRADLFILHFLNNWVPPPTITNIDVSYNMQYQTINIENVTVYGSEYEEINATNAYFHLYSILNSTFYPVCPVANLTWNGNAWEALNVNVSYLPEGNYYINVTFGDKLTFGNNTFASQLSTQFTIDHYETIYGVTGVYIGNIHQKLNLTIDLVNSSYIELGEINGIEALNHSFVILNATGYATSINGTLEYGNITGTYRWEALNISVASLAEGNYSIKVYFADYLGYGNATAYSADFTVDHILISTLVPEVRYEGNLTQSIHVQNINIETTYSVWGALGSGRMRLYNCSIFDANSQAFTGISTNMKYDGFSWYSDISVAALPEGDYYINAFFKDKLNDTVTTANSSVFTIDHTIDLTQLELNYTGEMTQELEIIVTPESTWTARGVLDDAEAFTKIYIIYPYNESTPIATGTLTWNGFNWTKTIDVSQYIENDYFVQVNFADSYANVTQNSSIVSIYHYISITEPTVLYNASTKLLNISNIIATCSYHGLIDGTTVIPTINSYTILASHIDANLTGTLIYSSPWHQTDINLSSLWYSSNFTIIFQFEVNESFGEASYSFMIPPKNAPNLHDITPPINEDGFIFLIWDAVEGATVYYIYRNTIDIIIVESLIPIAVVTTNSYQDIIDHEGTYWYVIVAGNAAGNTTSSNTRNVSVDFPGGGISGFELIIALFGILTLLIIYYRKRSFFLNNFH